MTVTGSGCQQCVDSAGRPVGASVAGAIPPTNPDPTFAFYPMAAYFIAGAVRSRWAKRALYGVAAVCMGLVALSRMTLRAHWPLDVLGGAALGISVVAAAVWWHERHPDAWMVLGSMPYAWRHVIYRAQNIGQMVLVVVVIFLLAESGPGLALLPAALILMYQITIPLEETNPGA